MLTNTDYWLTPSMLIKNNTAILFGEKVIYRYPPKRFAELNQEKESIECVIFVLAEASHPERRKLIRQTWGQHNRHIFFGVAGSFNEDLRNELEEHQDIVWINKEDKHQNRAYITTTMIYALTTHLLNFQYIWKTEDDVYVNVKKLGSWLRHPPPTSGLVGGCTRNAIVFRDPASKWYVSESAFNETHYPPYSVQTYAVSQSLAECISKKARDAPFVAPEDALVGILTDRCQQTCSDVGSPLYEDKLSMYDENTTTMVKLGEQAMEGDKLAMHLNKMHQRSCALGYSLDSSCANLLTPSSASPAPAPQTVLPTVSSIAPPTVPPTVPLAPQTALPTAPPTALPMVSSTKADATTNECHRTCKTYNNRLFFRPPAKGAGLNDRLYILGKLINIAGYLCATVDFPRPFHTLSENHNSGVPISINMDWSDLLAFNTSLYKNVTLFSTIPEPLRPFDSHFNGSAYSNWTHIWMERYNETSFSGVKDFIKANQTVTSQQQKMMNGEDDAPGFIWMLHDKFYFWIAELLDFLSEQKKQFLEVGNINQAQMLPVDRSDKCQERLFSPSDRLEQITDMVWNDIIALTGGLENRTVIGSLYLRRGDVIDECDTELPTIHDYLTCSLNGTDSSGARIVLLLSSDERNTTYRDAVLALASSFRNVQGLDLDKMIQEKLDGMVQEGSLPSWLSDNNFFVFCITQLVKGRGKFWLVRRRSQQCKPCWGPVAVQKLLN